MPTLRKIVATPNTDRPMYQKNIGSGRRSSAAFTSAPASVLSSARARSTRRSAQAARTRSADGWRWACFTFQRPALLDHQLRVAAPGPRRAGAAAAASPAMSAVLGDVVGRLADALADGRRCGGGSTGPNTIAPIAAGPGFPRATVEVDEHLVEHQGTRIAPQLSQWPAAARRS
jgi:hypothetical protein